MAGGEDGDEDRQGQEDVSRLTPAHVPPGRRAKMIIKLARKSKTYETRFEFDAIAFIW